LHQILQTRLDDSDRLQLPQMLRLIDRAFPDPNLISSWPQCQRYLAHAVHMVDLVTQIDLALPEAAHLLSNLATYFWKQGREQEATQRIIQAERIQEQLYLAT
jgi:hypothetical protein